MALLHVDLREQVLHFAASQGRLRQRCVIDIPSFTGFPLKLEIPDPFPGIVELCLITGAFLDGFPILGIFLGIIFPDMGQFRFSGLYKGGILSKILGLIVVEKENDRDPLVLGHPLEFAGPIEG